MARPRSGPVPIATVGEPASLRDPPANGADRRRERRSAARERPDRADDGCGRLALGGPSFGLAPQGGPAVGPGPTPLGRRAQESRPVGRERPPATGRQAARRIPRPAERHLEVPPGSLTLELERAMLGAEPDRHAVRQVHLGPLALAGSHADEAGRPVPEPPSLVEGLCHEAIIVPSAVKTRHGRALERAPTGRGLRCHLAVARAANWQRTSATAGRCTHRGIQLRVAFSEGWRALALLASVGIALPSRASAVNRSPSPWQQPKTPLGGQMDPALAGDTLGDRRIARGRVRQPQIHGARYRAQISASRARWPAGRSACARVHGPVPTGGAGIVALCKYGLRCAAPRAAAPRCGSASPPARRSRGRCGTPRW